MFFVHARGETVAKFYGNMPVSGNLLPRQFDDFFTDQTRIDDKIYGSVAFDDADQTARN